VCQKSLELIGENTKLNGVDCAVEELEWGNYTVAGKFDLVIGSDVIYLEECLQPLFDTFAFYLAEGGLGITINNKIRASKFEGITEEAIGKAGMVIKRQQEVQKGEMIFCVIEMQRK